MNFLSVEAVVDTIEELNLINFVDQEDEEDEYKKEELLSKFVDLERIMDRFFTDNENLNLKIYMEDFYESFIKLSKEVVIKQDLTDSKNENQFDIFIAYCNTVINLLRDHDKYGCNFKIVDKDTFSDDKREGAKCEEAFLNVTGDNLLIPIIVNEIARFVDAEDRGIIDKEISNEKVEMYMDILMEFIYTTYYDTLNHNYDGPSYKEKAEYVCVLARKTFLQYINKQKRGIEELGAVIMKFNKILNRLGGSHVRLISFV